MCLDKSACFRCTKDRLPAEVAVEWRWWNSSKETSLSQPSTSRRDSASTSAVPPSEPQPPSAACAGLAHLTEASPSSTPMADSSRLLCSMLIGERARSPRFCLFLHVPTGTGGRETTPSIPSLMHCASSVSPPRSTDNPDGAAAVALHGGGKRAEGAVRLPWAPTAAGASGLCRRRSPHPPPPAFFTSSQHLSFPRQFLIAQTPPARQIIDRNHHRHLLLPPAPLLALCHRRRSHRHRDEDEDMGVGLDGCLRG